LRIQDYLSNFVAVDMIGHFISLAGFGDSNSFFSIRFNVSGYPAELFIFDYFAFHGYVIAISGKESKVEYREYPTFDLYSLESGIGDSRSRNYDLSLDAFEPITGLKVNCKITTSIFSLVPGAKGMLIFLKIGRISKLHRGQTRHLPAQC
jgi:hypothetical protein